MRISKGRGWLAVVALGLRTAEGVTGPSGSLASPAGPHFAFSNGFEGTRAPTTDAIFFLSEVTERRFYWVAPNVTVDEISLFTYNPNDRTTPERLLGSGAGGGSASVTPTTGSLVGSPINGPTPTSTLKDGDGGFGGNHTPRSWLHIARAPPDIVLTVNSTEAWVQIAITNPSRPPIYSGMALFFRAQWSNAQSFGESYSRVFTFISSLDYATIHSSGFFASGEPHEEEKVTLKTTATPSAGDQNPDSTSPATSATASAVGGGLSSGAVIGIAVACGVVGLALTFVLVWYLLRRRQQKKATLAVGSSYGAGNRAEDLMAEKEAGADVDVSPHSPYSDEGAPAGTGPASGGNAGTGAYHDGAATVHGESSALTTATVGAAAHHQRPQDFPRSFTPYSDGPSAGGAAVGTPSIRAASLAQTDEVRVNVPSPTPGRATPRPLTTPYAHLVEEGMTEEEIRRLEEEERQLDAAIERAGRR